MTELTSIIEHALGSINPEGELPYSERRSLRARLEESRSTEGVRPWCALEVLCARKVWPVWQAAFTESGDLLHLLGHAEAALRDRQPRCPRRLETGEVQAMLDGKFLLENPPFPAIYAGFACWAAARSLFLPEPSTEAESELELDPTLWDASFYASLAWSGGATWENGAGDPIRRCEFWTWWLDEAIPEALTG